MFLNKFDIKLNVSASSGKFRSNMEVSTLQARLQVRWCCVFSASYCIPLLFLSDHQENKTIIIKKRWLCNKEI